VLGLEPLAVIAPFVRASGRQFEPTDECEPGALAVGEPIFGEEVEVADPTDGSEVLHAVDGNAARERVRSLAQIIAA
jgi:hypothetical protein